MARAAIIISASAALVGAGALLGAFLSDPPPIQDQVVQSPIREVDGSALATTQATQPASGPVHPEADRTDLAPSSTTVPDVEEVASRPRFQPQPATPSDPSVHELIRTRQEGLRQFQAILQGDAEWPGTRAQAARSAGRIAVQVILDARGESLLNAEGSAPDDWLADAGSRQPGDECLISYSGGMCYRVNVRDFPELAQVRALTAKHKNRLPIDKMPMDAIEARIEEALSYVPR